MLIHKICQKTISCWLAPQPGVTRVPRAPTEIGRALPSPGVFDEPRADRVQLLQDALDDVLFAREQLIGTTCVEIADGRLI